MLWGGALWVSFSCGCDGSPEDAATVEVERTTRWTRNRYSRA
jgi:hypothetical protein